MKKSFTIALSIIICQLGFSQHDYALAQHLSTYYLGAQRCGNTQSWIHPSGGCHMTDGQNEGVDLSGGWHDCGDYIKFHVTGPYTVLANLYGYDKYPEVYPDNYSQAFSAPPANGIPDILDEVKIETDYLIKCVNGNKIYWQVGGQSDHNSFKEPISNSNQNLYNGSSIRPVSEATEGHSNSFGNSAAALALMSIVYRPYDANYADQCLTAATSYYSIGKINATSSGDAESFAYSFMNNSKYEDEMGMGAIMLYRALGTQSYLTEATNYASSLQSWEAFTYSQVSQLLFLELYLETGTASYLNKVGSYISGVSNESCGYYHYSNWGSMRDAGNAAMIAGLYHSYTGDASAYSFAKGNVDFILGSHGQISADAPANFSFLIGYNELGGGYPQYPHHGAAFGKTSNEWTLYTQEGNNPGSVPFEYELTGGLAGGPESACANFEDNINNYISSEYCSYYNAGFTGAVAYINKVENVITAINPNRNNAPAILYPTVSRESITILNEDLKIKEIVILDISGNIISTQNNISAKQVINVSKYAAGVYFARISSSDSQEIIKFLKK